MGDKGWHKTNDHIVIFLKCTEKNREFGISFHIQNNLQL